jgi:hypothetical protein
VARQHRFQARKYKGHSVDVPSPIDIGIVMAATALMALRPRSLVLLGLRATEHLAVNRRGFPTRLLKFSGQSIPRK